MKNVYQILSVAILLLVGSLYIPDNLYAVATTASSSAKKIESSARPLKLAQKEIIQKEKSTKEIDRRTASLAGLASRISEMKKISDADKTLLISQIQDQIVSLNSLKTKIDGDNDQLSLKTDRQAIYSQYRIFVLFMPKIQILASADKIIEISGDINQVVLKLQERVSKARSTGQDVTSLQNTLTGLNNKLTDAVVQAKAAQDLVVPLVPDQGDSAVSKSNLDILKNARIKLLAGKKDLAGVTADIQAIRVGLARLEKNKTATPSANR